MDGQRFDLLTRNLSGDGVSRRTALGSLLGVLGLAAMADVDAKRKKHKKKKKHKASPPSPPSSPSSPPPPPPPSPPPPPCVGPGTLRDECDGTCCNSLICAARTECEFGHPYCCGPAGTACADDCDCCADLDLNCSERAGHTCQICSPPQYSCSSPADCCRSDQICGNVPNEGQGCCGDLASACAPLVPCCTPNHCSERQGNTCRDCGFVTYLNDGSPHPCVTNNDCCAVDAVCGTGNPSCGGTICCQEAGAHCETDSDCCDGFVCENVHDFVCVGAP
jgi:hypothetical protein